MHTILQHVNMLIESKRVLMFKLDDPKNNYKNVTHAFFLALAITIAEPSTLLPLMVHHFYIEF